MAFKLADCGGSLSDPDRLAAVAATRLLDTRSEPMFDRIAELARKFYRTETAFISLVDERRVFRKSIVASLSASTSKPQRELPVDQSLCSLVIATGKSLAVGDVRNEARWACDGGLDTQRYVSYAGVPLRIERHAVGTLAIVDSAPRIWTDDDLGALRDLAASVVTEIALRSTRKQCEHAQAAFNTLQQTLGLAMATAGLCTFDWDIAQDYITWSDNLEGTLGLVPGTFGGTFDDFMALVHPQDRERVCAALQQAVKERGPYACDFRMLRPDGSVRWSESRGRMVCDEQGVPLRLFGIDVDVTCHREAAAQQDVERKRLLRLLKGRAP